MLNDNSNIACERIKKEQRNACIICGEEINDSVVAVTVVCERCRKAILKLRKIIELINKGEE